MRRNLDPDELGDLLVRPLSAVLALHRTNGQTETRAWDYADAGYV